MNNTANMVSDEIKPLVEAATALYIKLGVISSYPPLTRARFLTLQQKLQKLVKLYPFFPKEINIPQNPKELDRDVTNLQKIIRVAPSLEHYPDLKQIFNQIL